MDKIYKKTVHRNSKKDDLPPGYQCNKEMPDSSPQGSLPDNVSVSQIVGFEHFCVMFTEQQNEIRNISRVLIENFSQTASDTWTAASLTPSDEDLKLLTYKEVSEILRVDIRTVYNYVKKGHLKQVKTPTGRVRFFQADVRQFLKFRDDEPER